jgi:signal transduction histidine kinase
MSNRQSFGLLGMRELLYPLGGTITVDGEKQKGTRLTVIIPLPNQRSL